jgi:hypothetical protein
MDAGWESAAMQPLPFAAEEVPWSEIPGVRIIGAILGTLLLVAAIKSMFGGKGGKGRR